MRLTFLNDSKQSLGGGWSFSDYLSQGILGLGHTLSPMEEADVCIIPSATMVRRDTVIQAKKLGKKILLRVDNIPRNSRNRNTGTSRLRDYANLADAIVYQSYWSRDLFEGFLPSGEVIYNGVDTRIFNPLKDSPREDFDGQPTYLYSRYNRDETKNWEIVWYEFQKTYRENPAAQLIIVGNFSDDLRQYNFDFFRGENFKYLGIISDRERLARIYRGATFTYAPYFNDACSNTYIESLCCGTELYDLNGMTATGGTKEIIEGYREFGWEYFGLDRLTYEYMAVIGKLV